MPGKIGSKAVETLSYLVFFRKTALFMMISGIFGLVIVNSDQLWNDMFTDPLSVHTAGRLIKKEGSVKHKKRKSPIWREVERGETSIANGDSVFTGSDGKAELEINDGNKASLNPSSLVVIDSMEDSTPDESSAAAPQSFFSKLLGLKPQNFMLKVDEGQVKIDNNGNKFVIQANNKTYKMESKKGGTMELSVNSKGEEKTVILRTDGLSDVEVHEVGEKGEERPVRLKPGIMYDTVNDSSGEKQTKFKLGSVRRFESKKKAANILSQPIFIAYGFISLFFLFIGYILPFIKTGKFD